MKHRTKVHVVPALALLALTALTACDDSPSEPEELTESVRQATAQFASTSAAVAAGYVADEHCVSHPQFGGMGFHWVNDDLVDPVFDPMQPEALLYAPEANGARKLVAVEYIVIDANQDRPGFDGHPFDVEGVPPLMDAGVAHWSLHVWLHETNPSGMFTPFNPSVSCE